MINPKLFREFKTIDHEKHPMMTIFKVVRYGDLDDFKAIIKMYSPTILAQFLKIRGKELDEGERRILSLFATKRHALR